MRFFSRPFVGRLAFRGSPALALMALTRIRTRLAALVSIVAVRGQELRAAFTTQALAKAQDDVIVQGAGMRLLFCHTELRQHVENDVRLNF
jgi:hypothetical protein